MKKLTTREIRQAFLEYFQDEDHQKIGSSSVVPKNDPTLLFINSGMAPLKKYFLGQENPPYPRLVNYQPCIRTKDIDDVGDRHHLTFFEMLGSWSIGDYYKEKAVELAFDLLVKKLGFDPKKLYVTVYEGNKEHGLKADTESALAWEKVGIPKEQIIALGADNFWGPAGETGPCGPCTEVFFDCGESFGPKWKPGEEFITTGRYIEIWNAGVFMELNKEADGTFSSLPLKSVDTGSGLERMAMIMNGLNSVYDTDLFVPIVNKVKELFNPDEHNTYMISDHLRASAFIMSDGVGPSNEGQGYIPRRLLRKCIGALASNGHTSIDFNPLLEIIRETLGDFYPSLNANFDFIQYEIKAEIDEFLPLIHDGIKRIDSLIPSLKEKVFPGNEAFELVTTFGVPHEVIKAHLGQLGYVLDEKGFDECFENHRKISRVVKGGISGGDEIDYEVLLADFPETQFMGYTDLESESKILGLVKDNTLVDKASGDFFMVTESTPFYGESGGQVGDRGTAKVGSLDIVIPDCQKFGKVFLHRVQNGGEVKVGDKITLTVDVPSRLNTRRNHSATHLLHAALREVVGHHALQKGSHVNSQRLRFDFQNKSGLTEDELEQIESLVNSWIMENRVNETMETDYNSAVRHGALALFGENYGEEVRVVKFGDSVELCGGTHAENTGEIGLFAITSETSVAKGVRRIEAVTGMAALNLYQQKSRVLKESAKILGTGVENVPTRILDLKKKSKPKKEETKVSALDVKFEDSKELEIKGKKFFVAHANLNGDVLKTLGDQLIDKSDIVCLIGAYDNSVRTFVWVKKDLSKKLRAGDLLKEILKPLGGRGGGKPHFAQGGGGETSDIPKVFDNLSTVTDFIAQSI
jgi:alanyl-tRNA synthetase